MRTFSIYEFGGILAPGSIVLIAAMFFFPQFGVILSKQNLSVGDLGIFVILAYVAGQLIQTVGNFLEMVIWKLFGGWPQTWLLKSRALALDSSQLERLRESVKNDFDFKIPERDSHVFRKSWLTISREIHVKLLRKKEGKRLEIFNGYYGLNRGVSAAFLSIAVFLTFREPHNPLYLIFFSLAGLAAYRMYRFSIHFSRELIYQYLSMKREIEN